MIDTARGSLLGLAVGDALGQPTEGWSPDAIKSKWGYIESLPEGSVAVSDDTEYALFSAQILLKYGMKVTSADFAHEWIEHIVPQSGPFKGAGFSEMAAIDNLRRGMRPPDSGKHYHSWSDGLAMRAAPFGIVARGDPSEAARLAEIDGVVSHEGEGIYAGQVVAAAIAAATTGASLDEIVAAAIAAVPGDSWTARNIAQAREIGVRNEHARGAIRELHDAFAIDIYPWADLAPEAAGLAFGLLVAGGGDMRDSLLAAVNLGRDADTVAAIIGAILGAQSGVAGIPQEWHVVLVPAEGRCLACVKGIELFPTADALVRLGEDAES